MRESLYLDGNETLVEVLKKIPAFKAFCNKSLQDLVCLTKLRTFSPQEVIIKEGDTEQSMYLLISGSVSIYKNNKKLATLKRTGDVFGEMSLLEEGPRSASVIADTDCSCILIDAAYLESLEYEGKNSFHAAIYQMFAQILTYRLRMTTEKYTEARQEIEALKKEVSQLKEGQGATYSQ